MLELAQELAVQDISQAVAKATHQITPQSRRIYEHDAQVFAAWLNAHGGVIDQDTLEDYRNHLSVRANYAPATGKRMWSVARRIVVMQIRLGQADAGVLEDVKGIKAEDESPHIALTVEQARRLLAAVPQDTRKGKRDRAILLLLLHTGIRRSECATLQVGSLAAEQGHTVLWVLGKGNRREKVKVPVQVARAINDYQSVCGRQDAPKDAPLFVHILKGDHSTAAAIGAKAIERVVLQYAAAAGIVDLTPHGMRATFITLALEGGARLEQVQYAARHRHPTTTERYQRRKVNLDDNAVDYVRL